MSETKSQYYLWGIWIFWGSSIIAFALSQRMPMFIALSGMGYFFLLLIMPKKRIQRTMTSVFNLKKKDELQVEKNAGMPASADKPAAPALPPAEEKNLKETTISMGTVLRGEITNENNITINGIVEGDLTSQKVAQIGKEGQVSGRIKSQKLIVNGLLQGSCYAQSVVIMSRGRIEGDVYAAEFSIEKGGVFIGNSHLLEEEKNPVIKKEKKPGDTADVPPVIAAPEVKPV